MSIESIMKLLLFHVGLCYSRIRVMDSSRTHNGHSGIVEAARDLFTQIEGDPGGKEFN